MNAREKERQRFEGPDRLWAVVLSSYATKGSRPSSLSNRPSVTPEEKRREEKRVERRLSPREGGTTVGQRRGRYDDLLVFVNA